LVSRDLPIRDRPKPTCRPAGYGEEAYGLRALPQTPSSNGTITPHERSGTGSSRAAGSETSHCRCTIDPGKQQTTAKCFVLADGEVNQWASNRRGC
jgi:hypothetical protein